MDSHYSPHFKKSELDCGCGCDTPPHIAENLRELAGYLEIIRERIRQPITVSSGYRCPTHNRKEDGGIYSQHLLGKAADLVTRLHPGSLAWFIEELIEKGKIPQGGLSGYVSQNFVHYDYRGRRARW